MAMKITESMETKMSRRVEILKEIFVGCNIVNSTDLDPGTHILHIKTPVGRKYKTIAYLEYDTGTQRPRDEFHILYAKLQPMVSVAIDRFEEVEAHKLERWMPEIIAIAHYQISKRYDNMADTIAQSDYGGRIDACVEILRSIGDVSEEE